MGQLHGELLQSKAKIADRESAIDRLKILNDGLKESYDDLKKEFELVKGFIECIQLYL